MTITKEQFQTFQQHFTVTEVARARVEANAEINFDDFKEYQNDPDTFFVDTIWNQDLPGEIVKSEGYYIRHVSTNDLSNKSATSTTLRRSSKITWTLISPNTNKKVKT